MRKTRCSIANRPAMETNCPSVGQPPGRSEAKIRALLLPALIGSALATMFCSPVLAADAATPSAAKADRPATTSTPELVAQANQASRAVAAADASAAPPSAEAALNTVTVTAQRVKQLSQTVPVAITTLSSEALKDQGGASVIDLARIVPGLTVRDSGPVLQFNVRGAATIDNTGYHEGVVAVYNDDVYRSFLQGVTGRLIDVERVEVLRGPQGLLFGRNTTGGVVHFISRQPTRDFEANASVGFGNYGQKTVEGAVSGPLSPTVAARVALLINKDDGWQTNDNQQPGHPAPAGGRLNAIDSQGGRVSLLFTPNRELTALVSGTVQRERNIFQGYTGVGAIDPARVNTSNLAGSRFNCPSREQLWSGGCVIVRPPLGLVFPVGSADWRRVSINLRPDQMPSNLDLTNVTAKITYDLNKQWSITSITGYEDIKKVQADEFDGTTVFALENVRGISVKQFTQELRAAGTFDDKSTLTLGLFYFDTDWNSTAEGASTIPANQTRNTKSTAVFGQYARPLGEHLTAKFGLRWTGDDKTVNGTSLTNGTTSSTASKESFVTGQTGLEWNVSRDQMFYFTAAKAQKSGEFGDVVPPAAIGVFRPERVTNFELGQKLEFWNRRARLNASVYYNETQDKQFTSAVLLTDGTAAGSAFNIGDVITKGVDLELLVKPARSLELGLNLAYTHSEMRSPFVRTRTFAGTSFRLDGNRMVGTPEWQVGPSIKHTHGLGDVGTVTSTLSYKWQSKVFWDVTNEPFSTEEAYGLLSGSVRWDSADGKYHVRAWGTNLADKQYANLRFALVGFPAAQIQWGHPRRVGIELGVKWF